MTDETKKLFDAPWKVDNLKFIQNAKHKYLALCDEKEVVNRLARLPELYDALDKAAPYCPMWLTNEIVTLLQKVRDGE